MSKISPQPFKIETSNLVYRFTTTSCIMGLKWAFSYLFFPKFVLFSFSPDFSSTISPQPFKIETSNLVYRFTTTSYIMGLKMGLLLLVLPYICSFFFLSRVFVKDISITFLDRNFKFGIQVHNDKLYCEIANGHSPICSSLPFSFFPDFWSKISPQPFKIETSNLVYRFTTTSCIVESKSYLFFHIFVLFSFSLDFSSKISPQPSKIETSNLV